MAAAGVAFVAGELHIEEAAEEKVAAVLFLADGEGEHPALLFFGEFPAAGRLVRNSAARYGLGEHPPVGSWPSPSRCWEGFLRYTTVGSRAGVRDRVTTTVWEKRGDGRSARLILRRGELVRVWKDEG
jgi:hypothetical protein